LRTPFIKANTNFSTQLKLHFAKQHLLTVAPKIRAFMLDLVGRVRGVAFFTAKPRAEAGENPPTRGFT
jgi:hypothetical protein